MENEQTAVAVREAGMLEELRVDDVKGQVLKIQSLMKELMKEGEHYGIIPGTQKPSLLKPGAEKLCFMFRLIPEYDVKEKELPNGHREYEILTRLLHNGVKAGEGVGLCTTMEPKYRYRQNERKCPMCGKETIFKSKKEEGGWFCWAKKGGCGVQFPDGDESIEKQEAGKKENPDIADTYNTVLKMAKKRSVVDATITACAASDIFTQDVEDFVEEKPKQAVKNVTPGAEGEEESKDGNPGPDLKAIAVTALRKELDDLLGNPAISERNRDAGKRWLAGDKLSFNQDVLLSKIDHAKGLISVAAKVEPKAEEKMA